MEVRASRLYGGGAEATALVDTEEQKELTSLSTRRGETAMVITASTR